MSTVQRGGGLLLGMRDPAELKRYAAPVRIPPVDIASLPKTQGYKQHHRPEFQGKQSSCRGFAMASCMERSYFFGTKGQKRQYSTEFSYLSGQKLDGIEGDLGSSIVGGCKAAIQFGLCDDETYPYTGVYPRGGWRAIPQPVWAAAGKTTLGSYAPMGGYLDVLSGLHAGYSVMIGIEWNETCQADAQGRLWTYTPGPFKGDQQPSGHALMLADWDKTHSDAQGRPSILMANWHEGYGIDGWVFVAPNIVDWWCKNADVVLVADVQGDFISPRDTSWLDPTKPGIV